MAEADDRLRLAELRVELGARNAAAVAEKARMARLQILVDSLAGPSQQAKALAVLAAYRKAEEALRLLLHAAEVRQAAVIVDLQEVGRLARIGDMPVGVDVELDSWGCQALTANGVRVQASDFQTESHVLIRDVAAAVVEADTKSSAHGNELVALSGRYRQIRLDRLMQLAGTTEGS